MRYRAFTILRHYLAMEIAKSPYFENCNRYAVLKMEWLSSQFDYFEEDVFDVLEDLEEADVVRIFATAKHPHMLCIMQGGDR